MIGSGGGVVLARVSPDGNLSARWLAGWLGSGNGRWKELRGDAGCQLGLGSLRRPPTLAGKKGRRRSRVPLTFTVLWVRRPSTKTGDRIELISKPFAVNCRKVRAS